MCPAQPPAPAYTKRRDILTSLVEAKVGTQIRRCDPEIVEGREAKSEEVSIGRARLRGAEGGRLLVNLNATSLASC
jgi:hypothetical protein